MMYHPNVRRVASVCGLIVVACASLSPAAADYKQDLEEYTAAQQQYEEASNAYWSLIAGKRRARIAKHRNNEAVALDDYVLTQPPAYSGPPKPVDPTAPSEEPEPLAGPYVPVVADFVRSAAEQFNFVPQRPRDEMEYKRAYARLAAAAGLSREQVVRIYAFEAGGNGAYDVQAGLEQPTAGAHAINTALGYNQLLATNSIGLVAEKGDRFIASLRAKAAGQKGEAKAMLESKIATLQRMIDFCRTVPDQWSEHQKLANTPAGWGVHALILDIDVGPLLQVQKLVDSVRFAQERGYVLLDAVQLEMMNLTGDGNGMDMIMLPPTMRAQVSTSNFFQRGGYERNPIAARNNVVAKLLAATASVMDEQSKLQGAMDLATVFRT
jgi:hypothetical protein